MAPVTQYEALGGTVSLSIITVLVWRDDVPSGSYASIKEFIWRSNTICSERTQIGAYRAAAVVPTACWECVTCVASVLDDWDENINVVSQWVAGETYECSLIPQIACRTR